jgi:ethanolamine ammonia-lyase small subunit
MPPSEPQSEPQAKPRAEPRAEPQAEPPLPPSRPGTNVRITNIRPTGALSGAPEPNVRNTNIGPDAGPTSLPAAIDAPAASDPWIDLRRYTAARIALGRSGGSQRTASVLDFRLAHARARDAVHAPFDAARLLREFTAAGLPAESLATEAGDRTTYLQRPDYGRRLAPASREKLAALGAATATETGSDLVLIVSDGLAAQAAERHAAAVCAPLASGLRAAGWRLGPIFVVPFARVKLQDEIGALLRARYTLLLLGERPGLGAPDSLGAYFTKGPAPDRTDADRNCVSNIRAEGLPPAEAARKLARLLLESARSGRAGVALKDEAAPTPPTGPALPAAG